jgi:hypothetical protein
LANLLISFSSAEKLNFFAGHHLNLWDQGMLEHIQVYRFNDSAFHEEE